VAVRTIGRVKITPEKRKRIWLRGESLDKKKEEVVWNQRRAKLNIPFYPERVKEGKIRAGEKRGVEKKEGGGKGPEISHEERLDFSYRGVRRLLGR